MTKKHVFEDAHMTLEEWSIFIASTVTESSVDITNAMDQHKNNTIIQDMAPARYCYM